MKYEKKSFSKILYKFLYESGIVTFQKILISNNSGHAFFSEGRRKDKTYYIN